MQAIQHDLGLLILRLTFGLTMLLAHGMPKLIGFTSKMNVFPDPLGVGSSLSLGLAIFSEVLCALLISVGLYTRLNAIPLFITMFVAVFLVHGDDPFGRMEKGLLFMLGYLVIFLLGPGKFSIDSIWRKKV